jgi:hypothetical protein
VLDAREYQIIQEENTRFRVLIEPLPGVELDRERAEQTMHEQLETYDLAGKLDVTIEVVERLAGEDDQKFKRIVSKVAKPEANSHASRGCRRAGRIGLVPQCVGGALREGESRLQRGRPPARVTRDEGIG